MSGFDLKHRFVDTILYDIPFFHNLRGAGKICAGWLAGFDHHDGAERLPLARHGITWTPPAPASFRVRTSARAERKSPQRSATWQHWFNTAAFTQAPLRRFGTSPRTDAFRLPGLVNVISRQTKTSAFQSAAGSIPRGDFQPVQPLQSRPANGGHKHELRHLRHHRRRSLRHHDARDSVGSKAELLGPDNAPLAPGLHQRQQADEHLFAF